MTDRSWLGIGRSRRKVLAGVAGAGATAAGWVVARHVTSSRSLTVVPKAPPIAERKAVDRAADTGGYANRDSSFAGSQPAPPPRDLGLFDSASEAARATKVTVPTILATGDPTLHLLRRATLGPTPALVDQVHAQGIDAWIDQQLRPSGIPDEVADGLWLQFPLASLTPAQTVPRIDRFSWDAGFDVGKATLARQIWSRRQLFEVMVDFWANHLNVQTPGPGNWDSAASWHNDIIRQHALGSFTDMLLAAMRHPSMLRYLSADQSHKESVNENLGRELLELHTVGIDAGYTEEDVRASAYILTGRTTTSTKLMGAPADFVYDPSMHWTGAVKVMTFTHANGSASAGLDVGDAYLRYLATHPSTAHSIARKLAVRFVADNPPAPLVERLAKAYLSSGTAIVPVLETLFRSGEFWAAVGQKTRRPLENLVAAVRALDVQPGADTPKFVSAYYWYAQQMGHQPLGWLAPNGYPDVHQAWRSTGALAHSWTVHRGLVQQWHDGVVYHPVADLVPGPHGDVGDYVDRLCRRLCFQTFQPPHRSALVSFVGGSSKLDAMIEHLVPLVLDSPYHTLR